MDLGGAGLPGKNFGQLRKVPVGKGSWVIFGLAQDSRQGRWMRVNSSSHQANCTHPHNYKRTYIHRPLDTVTSTPRRETPTKVCIGKCAAKTHRCKRTLLETLTGRHPTAQKTIYLRQGTLQKAHTYPVSQTQTHTQTYTSKSTNILSRR